MEELREYREELEQALARRGEYLESKILSQLKERFVVFATTFQSIYNLLTKKGLIKDDPYAAEAKIAEITLPPREQFPESARQEQMSSRLGQLVSQLDFLINYYDMTLEFLTFPRLKRIVGLMKYIDFRQVTITSPNPTAAGLAGLLERITHGSDSMAAGIVKDSVAQLGSATTTILRSLRDVHSYQKERYKLTLREEVLNDSRIASGLGIGDESLLRIKRACNARSEAPAFHRELAQQVLEEDYSAQQQELRREVLDRMEVPEEKKTAARTGPSYQGILLESLKLTITAVGHLQAALKKVEANTQMLGGTPEGFGQRLRRLFSRAAGVREDRQVFEVEYFDDATGSSKTTRVDLNRLTESIRSTVRLFATLSNRLSSAYRQIEAATDEQLYDFLNKHGQRILEYQKVLEGLETYFRSEVPREKRSEIRSLAEDLTALRGGLIRANKQKHEYVSRKEEQEQFRRLGIESPS